MVIDKLMTPTLDEPALVGGAMIFRVGFQRRCATVFAVASLLAPAQSLADEPSPGETYQGASHSEEEVHDAGALIFHQLVGEKIYIQEEGELYVVLEAAYGKAKDEREFELAAELSIGVTDRLQLVAEVPFEFVDPDDGSQHNGLGDITMGFQYNLVQGPDFSFGVRSAFVIPSGDEEKGLGGGQFVWEANLLGALRVGQSEIYAGVGSEIHTANSDGDPDAFTYTISVTRPWRQLIGSVELAGTVSGESHKIYLAPSLWWDVVDFLQAGIGVPIGLTSDSVDVQIVTLFVFEFF
jgi:hypothetical protein